MKQIINRQITRREKEQENTKYKLMKIIQENPKISQREIAKKIGISFGAVNYCINALISKGWIKINNFSVNKNKFGYIYIY